MTSLVCVDRDGTINKDENYFLGSNSNWKTQVEFLPGVFEGIKLLNSLSDLEVFVITNQSGVALTGPKFNALTEERMHEVNQHIIELLGKQGAKIKGYFACPYVNLSYLKKSRVKGRMINLDYVKNSHPDLKPNIGMIKKAAQCLGKSIDECDIYVIGDRLSDVQLGLNVRGIGILISSYKTSELGDKEKVKKLKQKGERVYIASDFLDATDYIKNKLK